MVPRKKLDLKGYFDRVVLINLKRRPDRLARVRQELRRCKWPFKQPEIFNAVDGLVTPPPPGWRHGPGAWGCLKSHQFVLRRAIEDGVKNLLVLEDDVCFVDDFPKQVEKFLRAVPDDWDQLMVGGQHINLLGEPLLVRRGVLRCTDCERRHCYAIRGEFMRKLCDRWQGGGKFNGGTFGDQIMGRDPEMQFAHKVYAPEFFLAGQERSKSDISGAWLPRKLWNPPSPGLSVVNLHAPKPVALALRQWGFYFGQTFDGKDGRKWNLEKYLAKAGNSRSARIKALREWITLIQWELAADPTFVCTIWHPLATPALVRAASLWKVYEITADSIQSVVQQLPPKLKRKYLVRSTHG